MVADIYEKNSWDTYYLGANTPIFEFKFCEQVKPDLIGLSLSVYSNLQSLIKAISTIRDATPIPIVTMHPFVKRLRCVKKIEEIFILSLQKSHRNHKI